MSSLSALRDAVKSRIGNTTDDFDSLTDSFINQALRKHGRRFRWKQLLVENAQLTLTTGTEQYALPSNFWQLVPGSVRWNVLSNSQGQPIKVVGIEGLEAYKTYNTQSSPYACAVVSAASGGTKRLEFAPAFTQTNIVVEYDYFKTPTALAEDSDEPEIPELEEVLIYEALVGLSAKNNDSNLVSYYRDELRQQLNVACQAFNGT